jgi:hypothetical protein
MATQAKQAVKDAEAAEAEEQKRFDEEQKRFDAIRDERMGVLQRKTAEAKVQALRVANVLSMSSMAIDETETAFRRDMQGLSVGDGFDDGEDGNEGKVGGDGEGATEMEALRAFAESVGYKDDIMDGIVTKCAGGAIEEIHWREKDLDGTLPMGDLNMPKLRVLLLGYNPSLTGEREERARERTREREHARARARAQVYPESPGMSGA